jgi:phenylacetate-coenzyme A ligase PaaK-like adenylate-forming protein|tara:strand:+ start:14 stop:1021 length:1008 start_codon:yes stop_codon:yes gene_type:complete
MLIFYILNTFEYMINYESIFKIKTIDDFESMAVKIFKYQFDNNKIYRSFCDLINKNPSDITNSNQIPFLPIKFFKSHTVLSSNQSIEKKFISSGTTNTNLSTHYITDLKLYESSFENSFKYFFGDIKEFTILALLPSYLENKNSSLIYMADKLIKKTNRKNSGFYLDNYIELKDKLIELKKEKVILIGVTFALLNLIEKFNFKLPNLTIVETGGMKGRRKEMIRNELHTKLINGFGTDLICSEYGMTELLSQAYSTNNGIFQCPPWMKIHIREPQDALSFKKNGITGGVNVIDLANINSCSFIATEDLGKKNDENNFEILGRFDNSDIRGCNLLV